MALTKHSLGGLADLNQLGICDLVGLKGKYRYFRSYYMQLSVACQ